MTHYGDSYYAVRRDKIKIAHAVIAELQRQRESKDATCDPFLQVPIADMVAETAAKFLERRCKGDDDEEFFAREDQIAKDVLAFIDQAVPIE